MSDIIQPYAWEIVKRYDVGDIKRAYRLDDNLEMKPETIPVLVVYTDGSPLLLHGGGGDTRRDASSRLQSVRLDSNATHSGYFSSHHVYSGTVRLFERRGERIRRIIFGLGGGDALDRAKNGKPFDNYVLEEDVRALFAKLPQEVKDVVGL
ncbi:MAG TPA: hypothetical protein VJB66_02885 [Candidatus Nanoarchaeia archaeon]|nr:hypothetical protein [Candidatus Nanoarchaeia archaeon]